MSAAAGLLATICGHPPSAYLLPIHLAHPHFWLLVSFPWLRSLTVPLLVLGAGGWPGSLGTGEMDLELPGG